MTSVEDRLRAATRAAGGTVTPDSVPPLQLPPTRRNGRPARFRASAWLAPLGAAAAAAAVVAASLTATHVIGAGSAPAGQHRITFRPGPYGLPPYFIRRASAATTPRAELAIYSSATGRAVATATLPGKLSGLAAGGDGRTFFAAMLSRCTASDRGSLPCAGNRGTQADVNVFYRITLTAAGARVRLLPIGSMPGWVLAISATPDGRKLAIFRISMTAAGQTGGSVLTVASTVTGRERNWTDTWPGLSIDPSLVSWLADNRRVAFAWVRPGKNARLVIHLLDTSQPGTDLLAGVTLLPPKRAALAAEQAISPDGSTVIAVAPGRSGLVGPGFVPGWSVVSLPGGIGQPLRVLFAAGPHAHGKYWNCQPLWVSHTGLRVLVRCGYHPSGGGSQHRVFLAGPGRVLHRLPWLEPSADAFTMGAMPER